MRSACHKPNTNFRFFFFRGRSQVFSAAAELVHDNCVVRGKEWDPFADDNDPKDMELKAELLGVQREVCCMCMCM